MKIGFVIHSLSSGGAERVLVNIANYLSKKYEIIIYTFSNEDSFYELNKEIIHKKLNLAKNSKNRIETIFNVFNRIKVLKNSFKDVDIVISFMTHTNILAIIASNLINKKIIISEHTEYHFYGRKINFLKKIFYPFSSSVLILTKADMKNYKFLKNIEVISNPINIPICKGKKEKIILGVGRLDKQKGFDILIEVFSKIKKDDWKLIIAGEGNERKHLEGLIKKLNLKNVKLIGKTKDIFSWYKRASIFVLSSKKEGLPSVLIEAMGCRCASISFNCPTGPNEIIEDMKNGILVENQNKKRLKEAIELLINSEKLRDKLAQEAVKVKDKYSIEKIGKKWEDIIYKVVND